MRKKIYVTPPTRIIDFVLLFYIANNFTCNLAKAHEQVT